MCKLKLSEQLVYCLLIECSGLSNDLTWVGNHLKARTHGGGEGSFEGVRIIYYL